LPSQVFRLQLRLSFQSSSDRRLGRWEIEPTLSLHSKRVLFRI